MPRPRNTVGPAVRRRLLHPHEPLVVARDPHRTVRPRRSCSGDSRPAPSRSPALATRAGGSVPAAPPVRGAVQRRARLIAQPARPRPAATRASAPAPPHTTADSVASARPRGASAGACRDGIDALTVLPSSGACVARGDQPLRLADRTSLERGARRAGEVAGRRVAVGGSLASARSMHRVERGGSPASAGQPRRRRRSGAPTSSPSSVSRANGDLPGEHREQHAAERVDVRARVDSRSPRICSGAT